MLTSVCNRFSTTDVGWFEASLMHEFNQMPRKYLKSIQYFSQEQKLSMENEEERQANYWAVWNVNIGIVRDSEE